MLKHLLIIILTLWPAAARAVDTADVLMPRAEDFSSMWWAEGFPSVAKGAPWRRVIQTGRYAFVLDTETLAVPHFGAGRGDWETLPPAELTLSVNVGGKRYKATRGATWTRQSGPRLIESGRFFQRADITDLIFESEDGTVLEPKPRLEIAAWPDRLSFVLDTSGLEGATSEIRFRSEKGTLHRPGTGFLAIDPIAFQTEPDTNPIVVNAGDRPVTFDPAPGWYRINLDRIEPDRAGTNDAMERIPFTLSNPTGTEQVARLMFEKTRHGFRQRIGTPITGLSAILRDADGHPCGIPVQLSKNWHHDDEIGGYATQWFHGISQVRLPAGAKIDLELVLVYGHWGGVAAASHAQLSLVGWGGNTLWDQSALGSWGESICYDPEQVQAHCSITDARPLMVTPMGDNKKKQWGWTSNVGGGDFFRFFDPDGQRIAHRAMQTTRLRQGPCLTEVTYSGEITDGIQHATTVSLARTDDIVRATYRLRMDVTKPTDFSRLAIFQVGADTYNFTAERKFAIGTAAGLTKEWDTTWGGDTYRSEPIKLDGSSPWISLHEGERSKNAKPGAWANRGIIIRDWKAKLGGKDAAPHGAERGVTRHRRDSSTFDLVPPPDVTRLEPGDFVEATIEHLIVPQSADDYYGPNDALRDALKQHANTWRMVHREAKGNAQRVTASRGTLVRTHPDIRIATGGGPAGFSFTGGIGYVPITFTGLKSHRDGTLMIDGLPLDQSVHGNDFWQTDFDPTTRTWSKTYNLPITDADEHVIILNP